MLGFSPTGERDIARYDRAAWRAYEYFGSYEAMAQHAFKHTGEPIAGNSFRRWLQERRLPIQYAAVLVDITDGAVSVADFFPWLTKYFKE